MHTALARVLLRRLQQTRARLLGHQNRVTQAPNSEIQGLRAREGGVRDAAEQEILAAASGARSRAGSRAGSWARSGSGPHRAETQESGEAASSRPYEPNTTLSVHGGPRTQGPRAERPVDPALPMEPLWSPVETRGTPNPRWPRGGFTVTRHGPYFTIPVNSVNSAVIAVIVATAITIVVDGRGDKHHHPVLLAPHGN